MKTVSYPIQDKSTRNAAQKLLDKFNSLTESREKKAFLLKLSKGIEEDGILFSKETINSMIPQEASSKMHLKDRLEVIAKPYQRFILTDDLKELDEIELIHTLYDMFKEFQDEIDVEETIDKAKQFKRLFGKIYEAGHLKTPDGRALGLPEIVLATSEYHPDLDFKARWYILTLNKEPTPEETVCPYCKVRPVKFTRDKLKFNKYEKLSVTCGSDECYGRFRSEYMKGLDVNPSQREDVKRKKAKTFREHYGVDNIFKRSDLMQEYWMEKLGVDNPIRDIEIRKKAVKGIEKKKQWQSPLEDEVKFILDILGIDYSHQLTSIEYNYGKEKKLYVPDFFLENNNTIIEVKDVKDTNYTNVLKYKATIESGYNMIIVFGENPDTLVAIVRLTNDYIEILFIDESFRPVIHKHLDDLHLPYNENLKQTLEEALRQAINP